MMPSRLTLRFGAKADLRRNRRHCRLIGSFESWRLFGSCSLTLRVPQSADFSKNIVISKESKVAIDQRWLARRC